MIYVPDLCSPQVMLCDVCTINAYDGPVRGWLMRRHRDAEELVQEMGNELIAKIKVHCLTYALLRNI